METYYNVWKERNAMKTTANTEQPPLYVVHPLDDAPETKRSPDGLRPIPMRGSVRASLIALRCYLIAIMLLAIYRILMLAGLFGHVAAK